MNIQEYPYINEIVSTASLQAKIKSCKSALNSKPKFEPDALDSENDKDPLPPPSENSTFRKTLKRRLMDIVGEIKSM